MVWGCFGHSQHLFGGILLWVSARESMVAALHSL
jgi:hypothetical protein